MSGASEPVGSIDVAVAHATRLLATRPALAAEQAAEILKVSPGHPAATLLLGVARRGEANPQAAHDVLQGLVEAHPRWGLAHYELARTLGALGRGDEALAALRRAVDVKPDLADAWRTLGDHLTAIGDLAGADDAYMRQIKASTRDPRLLEAAAAMAVNRLAPAEALLREHLKQYPTEVSAIRMLAEVGTRLGRYGDAERLLERALELAPSFTAARHNYAVVLHRLSKLPEALAEIDALLAAEPRNPAYRNLQAAILVRIGEYERAIAIQEDLLREYPGHAKVWMSHGHALKTAGRYDDSVRAYRRSIERNPSLGEAYWSLANLKTFRFTHAELAAMRTQLEHSKLTDEDRLHFHFAAGKALEDAGDYAASFEHYARANELRRKGIPYDAAEVSAQVQRTKDTLTRPFLAERTGWGAAAPDPIFIIGLPRSGSTLLEQVLSSHSAVEGTMELPDLISIVKELGGRRKRSETSKYPEVLTRLGADELREIGERYLERTRVHRKTDAPRFIDKMPNNFAHVGLIHLALPNATIIDARRHPLACCFSNFKQHFARGQHFSYSLEDIGRYYRDYVELMAHYDDVLPARVHRVIYETLVEDPEGEIRRLLEYCGLAFEDACLEPHRNERAVRTASSEQVRQPIHRDGIDHWRHYEAWLDPLKRALGPVLETYPAPPGF
jgi:tetratricopeptide (TPR) repeat protein